MADITSSGMIVRVCCDLHMNINIYISLRTALGLSEFAYIPSLSSAQLLNTDPTHTIFSPPSPVNSSCVYKHRRQLAKDERSS